MFCRNAMVTNVISAGPEQTIRDALGLLEKHGIRAVPIVDGAGVLLGQFTFDVMLSKLLPSALLMEAHGLMDANLRLDFLVDAEPDVAKRLGELLPTKLGDVMDRQVQVAHPDTPLWEGIRLLVQHGSPIPVVEETSHRLLGLLSVQSATKRLAELKVELN